MAQHEPSFDQILSALKKLGWKEQHSCDNATGVGMTTYTSKNNDMLLLLSSRYEGNRTYRLTPTSLDDLLGS